MKELQYQWRAMIGTVFVVILFGLITSTIIGEMIQHIVNADSNRYYNRFVVDLIFLGVTPSLAALLVSKPYLDISAIAEDPLSKRMALYRMLPIPIKVLSRSRIIVAVITLMIMLSIFYAVLFLALPKEALHFVSFSKWVLFCLIWFGYALALSGSIPYVESGMSTKAIYVFSFVNLILLIAFLVVIYFISDRSLVEWSFVILESWGLIAAIVSLLVGCLGLHGWRIALERRLVNRDYM